MPPVKTELLNAIKEAIEGVSVINDVRRNPSKTIDLETAVYDVAFVIDEIDSNVDRNRIQIHTIPLHIEIWIKEKTTPLEEQAEIYEAEILDVMLNDTQIQYWSRSVRLIESEKFFYDEHHGGLVMRFSVEYAHAYKDAYNPAKGI